MTVTPRRPYPLMGEGLSEPSQHDCEYPVKGVLCMENATGAIYSGWTDYVWLCQPHLTGEVAKGWERVDFEDDDDDNLDNLDDDPEIGDL